MTIPPCKSLTINFLKSFSAAVHNIIFSSIIIFNFQGVDVDTEPTYRKGWGFCSDAPIQESCNSVIPDIPDTSDIPTSILTDNYCVDKLEANLIVEQPGVPRPTYEPLLSKSGVFCVGRNLSRRFEEDLFYVQAGADNYQIVPKSEDVIVSSGFFIIHLRFERGFY